MNNEGGLMKFNDWIILFIFVVIVLGALLRAPHGIWN
jgi:hypothetical protein